ncbi:hypothetical protein [Okeania sp. SIO1I7]|nr:hypothetical protein [Okeania sp. SIO1I7]NET26738.1 hypothetical protein [Okeania sp. SIO1I7]
MNLILKEGRRKKAEDRRQKAEGRRQKGQLLMDSQQLTTLVSTNPKQF